MSNRVVHVTDAIPLDGYQAILEPGKFGYSLSAVVGNDVVEKLETERTDVLKWAESKLKNPKRSTLKPTPWEEVADGKHKLKFSWGEDKKPPVVDTEGTPELIQRRHFMEDLLLSLGFIKSLIFLEMALPMEVLLSWSVYKLSN